LANLHISCGIFALGKGRDAALVSSIHVRAGGLGAEVERREFIKLFGGMAARGLGTLTFGGAFRPLGSLAAPATTPLRTDVHCHLFNGYDLPVYGLLVSVFLEQNIFGALAIPIALWLAASIEGKATSTSAEKPQSFRIDASLPNAS
jgi:hypothetical protein